jgi:hypothetical protein
MANAFMYSVSFANSYYYYYTLASMEARDHTVVLCCAVLCCAVLCCAVY